jgi:Uma2 family endonuclease
MKETERQTRWTYEDYLLLPDDGKRYQIVRGELFMSAAPIPKHQIVSIRLVFRILQYVEAHRLGICLCAPIDLLLAKDSVVQPDIIFIQESRRGIIGEKYLTAAPDLVIEILSDSTRKLDLVLKRSLYAEHGVREYWIVDPKAERIDIHVLENGELVKKSEGTEGEVRSPAVLPGLAFPVREIFE